jgi:hypothetical protein
MEKTAKSSHAIELIEYIRDNAEYRDYYFGLEGDSFYTNGGFETLISLINIEKGQMMDDNERDDMQELIDALKGELATANDELESALTACTDWETKYDEMYNRVDEIDTIVRAILK